MSINGIRCAAIGVAAAFVLVACGSSGGDAGGSDDFCDRIRAIDAEESANVTASADTFEALIEDAPEEIRDDLQIVVDALAELEEIDEDDPAGFALLFEIFERPEVIDATETLERFGIEECGLDPASDDEAELSDGGIAVAEPEVAADGAATGEAKTTTVPGDPYDEEFWGPIQADELSIPGLKQHLDVNYAAEGWYDGSITGWSASGSTEIGVNADVEVDEALRICGAVLEYAGPISPEVAVRVDNVAAEELVVGTVAEGCAAA